MSDTCLVLGSNWTLDEWPEYVTVIHEAGVSHGYLSLKRRYMPERTCTDVRKPGVFFECSECGAIDVTGGTGNYTLEYCPSCGAKVEGD